MALVNHADIGDIWRPQATFTVAGVTTDPSELVVRVKDPAGTTTVTTASNPPALLASSLPISRSAAGIFIFNQDLDQTGNWYCRFEGTGNAEASEDHEIVVDPSPFYQEGGLWGRALVNLGEVKDWLGIRQIDTTQDAKITQRINAASKRIMEVAGREFKPAAATVTERSFDVYWGDQCGVKQIGDLATLTSSSATFSDLQTGAVTQTLTGSEFAALPRNRGADEPITALRFFSSASGLRVGAVLNMTGIWGFPSVPEDVQHACMDTVAFWLDRDVEHFRQDLGAVPGASEGGQTVIVGSAPTVLPLPPEAYSIAKSYKSMLVV